MVVAISMDAFERLLWWLFAGSTGAKTRLLVLEAIKEQPRNAQQLSQLLRLDYTTVRHHLGVLEKNRLVLTEGDKYGKSISFGNDGSKLGETAGNQSKNQRRRQPWKIEERRKKRVEF